MRRRPGSARRWRGAALAACVACAVVAGGQQEPSADGTSPLLKAEKQRSKHGEGKHASDSAGPKTWAEIPLTPLGFAPPSAFYLGDRLSQVSLDFLGEDQILFTFRVPGLIPRAQEEARQQTGDAAQEERNIRALVLALPSGRITAEATWRLHDFAPYMWMLGDGRFLLRDRRELQIGDATLRMEPFLRFPGMVKYVELDPEREWLVTQSVEPRAASDPMEARGTLGSDIASNAAAAGGGSVLPSSGGSQAPEPRSSETLLRVLRMRDRSVLLALRRSDSGLVHLPIDGDGYYDATRGRGFNWMISYRGFSGAEEPMLPVDSTCSPALDTLAPGVVLASSCSEFGRRLTVMTRSKHRLWELAVPPTRVWPMLARNSDGTRLARATLEVTHPIGPSMPLDPTDIRGETVQIFDVATGKVALTGPASPVLDGGGSFALSPSGKRFAVLNRGDIQVYELAAPPPLSDSGAPLRRGDR